MHVRVRPLNIDCTLLRRLIRMVTFIFLMRKIYKTYDCLSTIEPAANPCRMVATLLLQFRSFLHTFKDFEMILPLHNRKHISCWCMHPQGCGRSSNQHKGNGTWVFP